MYSDLTYLATRAKIDDLVRTAADRQRVRDGTTRSHAAVRTTRRERRYGLGRLRLVKGRFALSPATP